MDKRSVTSYRHVGLVLGCTDASDIESRLFFLVFRYPQDVHSRNFEVEVQKSWKVALLHTQEFSMICHYCLIVVLVIFGNFAISHQIRRFSKRF